MAAKMYNYGSTDPVTLTRGGPKNGVRSEFLAAISDSTHAEHNAMLEWIGETFDPAAFDLVATNVALQLVR